jgi:hypothetical protein
VSDLERGEPQDAVAGQPDVVLPPHVDLPLRDIHVVRTVDLHLQTPLRPVRVDVAHPSRVLDPTLLVLRRREPEPAAQAGQVDLGQRLRPAGQIVGGLPDERPPTDSRPPRDLRQQVRRRHQPLQATGGEDRARFRVGLLRGRLAGDGHQDATAQSSPPSGGHQAAHSARAELVDRLRQLITPAWLNNNHSRSLASSEGIRIHA